METRIIVEVVNTLASNVHRSALGLVQKSTRPDLLIKYKYATCLNTLGMVPEIWENAYLDNIRSFNDFFESSPRKLGPEDFLFNFKSNFESIKNKGFLMDDFDETIKVSSDNYLISGAHRTAICASLALDIPVEELENANEIFDYLFFRRRGEKQENLGLATMVKAEVDEELKCLILHGVVSQTQRERVIEEISNSAKIFSRIDLKLNYEATFILKFINYGLFARVEDSQWIGNPTNSFAGLRDHALRSTGGMTSFIFLQDVSFEKLRELKDRIRYSLDLGNFSVHTCDSRDELREVLYFSCHPNTVKFLNSTHIKLRMNLMNSLMEIRKAFIELQLAPDEFILGGSALLDMYSLRNARDFDFFGSSISEELEFNLKGQSVSISPYEMLNSQNSFEALTFDISKHIRFCGFNLITIDQLAELKKIRAEFPKDYLDLHLIAELSDQVSKFKVLQIVRRSLLFQYWKALALTKQIRFILTRELYRFGTTRRIFRKFRAIIKFIFGSWV
jgi:hypothetical protein